MGALPLAYDERVRCEDHEHETKADHDHRKYDGDTSFQCDIAFGVLQGVAGSKTVEDDASGYTIEQGLHAVLDHPRRAHAPHGRYDLYGPEEEGYDKRYL